MKDGPCSADVRRHDRKVGVRHIRLTSVNDVKCMFCGSFKMLNSGTGHGEFLDERGAG